MPHFKSFALDDFVFEWGPLVEVGLWDSCIEPLTLAELQAFNPTKTILAEQTQLRYGPRWGYPELRETVRRLYSAPELTSEDVIITSGCISANYLVLDTIAKAGDHVIVQHPTYNQLIELPRRAGAEVSLWKWRWKQESESMSWSMDFAELEKLLQPNTKLIVLSNPTNPTGSELSRADLQRVIEIARSRDIVVMCDEVFRFMHHAKQPLPPPSLMELGYEKTIVTGSVSKGFALPGVRVGWLAVHPALRDSVLSPIKHSRDYTTITVSQVDQQIASFALSPGIRDQILARTREICQKNIAILDAWVTKNKDWASRQPSAGGGTGVVRITGRNRQPVDDVAFAVALAKEEKVCAPPAGHCFGHEADGTGSTDLNGFLRIGIVMAGDTLERGLAAVERLRSRWHGRGCAMQRAFARPIA